MILGFGNILYGFTYFVMFFGVLYGSILAHEFGHAWGNRLVGGGTDQIILTPIGGVAMGFGADSSPKTELIVVALGPAVTVVFAIIGAALYYGIGYNQPGAGPSSYLTFLPYVLISMLFYINFYLGIFNLFTPIFPLDSAKLIRAGLSLKFNPQLVTLRLSQFGIAFAIICIILWFSGVPLPFLPGGSGSIMFGIIAIIGIQACLIEQQRIKYQDVYLKSDNWGGRQVYYDSDIMSYAKRTAAKDLGPFGGAFEKVTASKPRTGTIKKSERVKAAEIKQKAKIIDTALDKDPNTIDDLDTLKDMMAAAAEQEQYKLAAKIKKRIREVEAK